MKTHQELRQAILLRQVQRFVAWRSTALQNVEN